MVFSVSYMRHDGGKGRYFAWLSLFTGSMAGLLAAGNLLTLFMFWELVGISSWLLIGFWYQKNAAGLAAQQAFLVNRIGDAGFLLAIALLFVFGGHTAFEQPNAGQWPGLVSHFIGFGLLLAALTKSAQLPFQAWLSDAMEGPTPVSALLHAATMVAAGVFLLIKSFALLPPAALQTALYLGSATAVLGALAAVFQHDIKKMLAYSTISQLGYMVAAVGGGAPDAAALHLFNHAFFKAGLFLVAGSVIHSLQAYYQPFASLTKAALPSPQDMNKMGGLIGPMPWLSVGFLVCGAALAGLPFFTGYLSKENILNALWHQHSSVAMLIVASVVTPLYIGRAWWLIFGGHLGPAEWVAKITKGNPIHLNQFKIHNPNALERIPILILAALSVQVFYPGSWFLAKAHPLLQALGFHNATNHHASNLLPLGLLLATALALLLAWHWRHPNNHLLNGRRATATNFGFRPLYYSVAKGWILIGKGLHLIDKKIIDNLIDKLASGTIWAGRLVAWSDNFFVDGTVHLIVYMVRRLGYWGRKLQQGSAQTYFVTSVVVFALLLALVWLTTA